MFLGTENNNNIQINVMRCLGGIIVPLLGYFYHVFPSLNLAEKYFCKHKQEGEECLNRPFFREGKFVWQM